MKRRDVLTLGLASLSATALSPLSALAQGKYPDRPIRLVVPFAPGGVVDAIGRLWAERMKPLLGTVVVENHGGGGGVIGTAEVARAQPDGYTLLLGNTSTQVLNPTIMPKVPYDPLKDFSAVSILAISAASIIVHPTVQAKTLKELTDYAKANPGKLSYGSAGAGTMTNLAGELFKQITKTDIVHVPYKGAGPAIADGLAGHVPMMTPHVTGQVLDLHRAGKIRILAVTSPNRLRAAPDIPTAVESGLPDLIAQLFLGVFAPANTPKPVVEQIAQATSKAMAEPEFQKLLIQSGFEPIAESGPDQAQRYVRDELARLTPVIKAAGFKAE